MKIRSFERKPPTKFEHVMQTEWYRDFSWRDRLKILFGCNLVVMIGLAVKHNPGEFKPLIVGKVTKHTTPDGHMREVIETMLDGQK